MSGSGARLPASWTNTAPELRGDGGPPSPHASRGTSGNERVWSFRSRREHGFALSAAVLSNDDNRAVSLRIYGPGNAVKASIVVADSGELRALIHAATMALEGRPVPTKEA